MAILIFNIVFSLFMMLLMVLVKKHPNLISGYDKALDKENYAKSITKGLFITALLIIGAAIICYLLKLEVVAVLVAPVITVVYGEVVLLSRAKHNVNRFIVITFFIVGIIVIPAILICIATLPPKVIIDATDINISGVYGVKYQKSEIKTIEITDSMPKIKLRTNGIGMGRIQKGDFSIENMGKCKLLLQNHTVPPFIVIIDHNDETLFLNFNNPEETQSMYSLLQNSLNY